MLKSFRLWSFGAAAMSLIIAVLHVLGGGPEFHEPALASAMPAAWKAVFSSVWHEVTALLVLNGLFLIAAGMTWRKNTLLLALVLLLNISFAGLFFFYGVVRLGSPWILLQWILFTLQSVLIAAALTVSGNNGVVEEVGDHNASSDILPGATFSDTYVTRNRKHESAIAATRCLFDRSPVWITHLLNLRNRIVKVFGLVHETPEMAVTESTIGMFPVVTQSHDNVVLGFDDKHLDFRIVVNIRRAEGLILLTTLVKPHNIWGRIYLAIVMPFHRLIVPSLLSHAA